jgi:hypothetical protein
MGFSSHSVLFVKLKKKFAARTPQPDKTPSPVRKVFGALSPRRPPLPARAGVAGDRVFPQSVGKESK